MKKKLLVIGMSALFTLVVGSTFAVAAEKKKPTTITGTTLVLTPVASIPEVR